MSRLKGYPAALALREVVQAQLREGREVWLQVNGWSMAPLLHPGDLVEVRAVPASRIRTGAVVVVWSDGGFLTHRVLRAGAGSWVLKGDHSLAPDAPLPQAALVGLAVRRERGGAPQPLDTPYWNAVGAALAWVGLASAAAHRMLPNGLIPRCCRLVTRTVLAMALTPVPLSRARERGTGPVSTN
jgi:hypothetical protein